MIHQVCTLSTQFESGSKLRSQLLRWSRNSWRSDIKMLFLERVVWRKYPWLAVTSLDKMISPFTMVYGPIAILFAAFWEVNMFIIVAFGAYIIVTRIMKTLMYFTWSRYVPACKLLLREKLLTSSGDSPEHVWKSCLEIILLHVEIIPNHLYDISRLD